MRIRCEDLIHQSSGDTFRKAFLHLQAKDRLDLYVCWRSRVQFGLLSALIQVYQFLKDCNPISTHLVNRCGLSNEEMPCLFLFKILMLRFPEF